MITTWIARVMILLDILFLGVVFGQWGKDKKRHYGWVDVIGFIITISIWIIILNGW